LTRELVITRSEATKQSSLPVGLWIASLALAMTENIEGTPMAYVDGFIVAVPKENIAAYRKLSIACGKVWREHGALDYREWVADDVKVGKLTSFPRAVKLKPNEIVVFSWITYKSRAQRDKVNAKVIADPRLKDMMNPKKTPFDGKLLIYGGFESLVKV
jgi:uncharacterized protein YbaA (DUF1428 family)